MVKISVNTPNSSFVIKGRNGQPIAEVLLNNGLPPLSFVILADGNVISDTTQLRKSVDYQAFQIEGYDIELVRNLSPTSSSEGFYRNKLLNINSEGDIRAEEYTLGSEEFCNYIEQTLVETLENFDLITPNESVVIGLSGGVDSTALLTGLCNIKHKLPPFELIAVTIKEPWTEDAERAMNTAKTVAKEYDVAHHVIDSKKIRDRYNLIEPVSDSIQRVSESNFASETVAITDQIITRELEAVAKAQSASNILLAAHKADVVANHIDPLVGSRSSSFPRTKFGEFTHSYPSIFLSKKELSIYLQEAGEVTIKQQFREGWKAQPDDENLIYYISEMIQWYWPGIEYWIVGSGTEDDAKSKEFSYCKICGKLKEREVLSDNVERCKVCSIFSKLGLRSS